MNYGRAIRILRAARGMLQREVAERAGVVTNYVCLIEQAQKVPSLDVLESISAAVDAPLWLLVLLASSPEEAGDASQVSEFVLQTLLTTTETVDIDAEPR